MTGIPFVSYENIFDLSLYDVIIYFGGLYAGGVKGLKHTLNTIKNHQKLIIVTVGLADVKDKQNTEHIKESISRQVPKEILDRTTICHLRGGIDYSRLNFKHQTMMKLYMKAKHLPEEKKTPEVKSMIETYNSKVDFFDENTLKEIVEYIAK